MEIINDDVELTKKKKGRPKKTKIEDKDSNINPNPIEKKKRGRKKKPIVEEVKQKKKRGRKAAVKFFSSSIRKQIPLTTVIHDNNNYILHLDIKDDLTDDIKEEFLDLPGIEKNNDITDMLRNDDDILSDFLENCEIKNEENLRDLYERRIENRENQDKLLFEKLENIHKDEEILMQMINKTEIKSDNNEHEQDNQIINRKKGYFEILHKFIKNDNWLHSSEILCWWCCHKFDTIPLGLPVEYDTKIKKFRVKGIFCSFPCMNAYNEDSCSKNGYKKYLIKFLYSKITGQSINSVIKTAPPRCCLKVFGGDLTIDEFRKACECDKIYKLVEYPMYVSKDYIEEVDLINVKNANMKLFNPINDKKNNNLDQKKIQDAKLRMSKNIQESTVITGGNTIDKFII